MVAWHSQARRARWGLRSREAATAAPLRKADDAITLDNSEMTIPEQKEWLMKQYQKAAEK